jgi:hypothetical protein
MQWITEEAFLELARQAGIEFDPKYPRARSLTFLPNEESRFWTRPTEPSDWPRFVSAALRAAGAVDRVAVMRRRNWPQSTAVGLPQQREMQPDRTVALLYGALGIPDSGPGAIVFDPAERDRLIALIVCSFIELFGDLYVLPARGNALLQFTHHEVVHISCPTAEGIAAVVTAMSAAKYDLPTELPDSTFKQPAWMKRNQDEAKEPL